jgi:branched-chain amino acid transport system permease protein
LTGDWSTEPAERFAALNARITSVATQSFHWRSYSAASCAAAALLWGILTRTDTGKAIRAVAKEKTGAALSGVNVDHIYAVTFGLGAACLAIAACLLMPTFLVNPRIGNAFVLVAFTIVVLGGMGSIAGALVGGLIIGVVESLSGLYFGESLGQIGIFLIFILVLLFRPTGLFGAKA